MTSVFKRFKLPSIAVGIELAVIGALSRICLIPMPECLVASTT